MAWDPREDGADCDRCLLRDMRDGSPVPSELRPGSLAFVVAEAPGEDEVEAGAPLVGKSGTRLMQSLASQGVYRDQISLGNVLSCRPPRNRLDRVLQRLATVNKENRRRKLPLLPSPVECCAPRLRRELAQYENVIPLGKFAIEAVLNVDSSIFEIRGGPVERDGKRILPTLHPAYILRRPSERFAFDADIGRAVRWFSTGRIGWIEPSFIYQPTWSQVRDYLNRLLKTRSRTGSWDVETLPPVGMRDDLAKDPLLATFALVSIFNEEIGGISIQKLSKVDRTPFYSDADWQAIAILLQKFFLHPSILKTSWNGGYYDRMNVEKEFGVTPKPIIDYILVHRCVHSEVKHSLGYAGSVWTDVPAWKNARKESIKAETDDEWRTYNATDSAVTDRAGVQLWPLAIARDQKRALAVHHKVQSICVGMHKIGMLVDVEKRDEHDIRLRADAIRQLKVCRETSGDPTFNPNSVPQVRRLLYDTWDLPAVHYSKKSGDPSTDDEAIRALAAKQLPLQISGFLDGLRRFRRATKYRGTYVRKMIPYDRLIPFDDLSDDEEDLLDEDPELEEVEKEQIKSKKGHSKKWGIVRPDGRVHADYNAHTPSTQRIASSNPNMQNFPRALRDLFVPGVGHVFAYTDSDQLELRFATAIWWIKNYIDVFNTSGSDPHDVTATLIFGEMYSKRPAGDEKSRLRDFAKRFCYAVLYGAEIETIHEVIISAEDKKGDLPFAGVPLSYTQAAYDAWIKANPEIQAGWEAELALFDRQGYLAEPVLGFRRDFLNLGGEKNVRNEILNFRCQAGGAGLMHLAGIDLVEGPIPFDPDTSTGIVNYSHDSFTAEIPIEAGEQTCVDLEIAMCREVPGLPIKFTAKAKLIERWA